MSLIQSVPSGAFDKHTLERIKLIWMRKDILFLSHTTDIQKNMVNKSKGFARKVVSELKQDGKHSSSDTTLLASGAAEQSSPKKRAGFFSSSKNLFGLSQNTTRNNSAVQESPPVPLYHTSPDQRWDAVYFSSFLPEYFHFCDRIYHTENCSHPG